jgi:uncharacterized protein (DUF111 family)
MKKNRPGVKLSVICDAEQQKKFTELLLTYTSTFGVRYKLMDRDILDREFVEIQMKYGSVRCKIGRLNGATVKVEPEYEDCRRIAKEQSLPISKVYNEILEAVNKTKTH